jgi:hypothetical protein
MILNLIGPTLKLNVSGCGCSASYTEFHALPHFGEKDVIGRLKSTNLLAT